MNTIPHPLSEQEREERRKARRARVTLLHDEPTLHLVYNAAADYAVWLDAGFPESGLIVGLADTREGAIADAIKTLEAAVEALQGPPEASDAD